jgi:spermidine/putrescine transport system substrate-binding protein
MKQFPLILVLILSLTFSLSAQEATESPVSDWECPEGYAGDSLDILGWFGYDDETTISNFEEACDVTIHYTSYDDEYFMLDTMRLGNPGYDILYVSGTMVELLNADGLAIPLDLELIPNKDNVAEAFLNPVYDPENEVSLPYLWGSVGIGYKKEVFPDGISSWEQVWNHDGTVAWINDQRAILGVALQLLGYDANSTNASQISEARDYLGEHGDNLLTIFSGSAHPLYDAGEADIITAYSYNSARWILNCDCETYGFAIPEEGSNIYVDNMLVPVDAEDPELAMVFMDYLLDPVVNAGFSNLGAGSTNALAAELGLIDARLLNETGFNPSEEVLANMFFIEPLEEDVTAFYDVAWNDLLLFYGIED